MKKLLMDIATALIPRGRDVWRYLKALKAYEAGDYTSALHEWYPLAEQGNARAQVKMGSMYNTGTGVPKNKAEAERWYRLAAEQSDVIAQFKLGEIYDEEYYCVQQDDDVPWDWSGRGQRNNKVAERWYRLAAEQGHTVSQWRIGEMYYTGCESYGDDDYWNLENNAAEAERWFRLAAKKGYARAQHRLGQIYRDDLEFNAEKSLRWCRLAAKQGYAPAQNRLGEMYSADIPYYVQRDAVESVRWFRLAAKQGDVISQWNLGQMYALGDGVIKDIVSAHMWCKISIFNHGDFVEHVNLSSLEELEKEMTQSEIVEAKQRATVCVASNYRDCD